MNRIPDLPPSDAALSSPLPACCTRDLESRGDHFFALGIPSVFFAAIDPSPDLGAFGAGVELMVFTALFVIGSLLVLNWVIKTMRSSK